MPTIEEDEAYYENNEMSRRLIPESEMDEEQLMYKYELMSAYQAKTVSKHLPKESSILEIGSGYGWVIEKLKAENYVVEGIEISGLRRKMAIDRAGIKLHNINLLDDKPPYAITDQFDCVCMFNLFEHISSPVDFLKRSAIFLKNSGKIIIEVPNFDNYLKCYSEGYKNFMFFRGHVSYFTQESLESTMRNAGFTDIQIYGKQTYSAENAVHWVRNNVPFKPYCQIDMPEGLAFINDSFKQELEENMTSDMLVAVGRWQRKDAE
jgi:SAM-dependent methyltransferase